MRIVLGCLPRNGLSGADTRDERNACVQMNAECGTLNGCANAWNADPQLQMHKLPHIPNKDRKSSIYLICHGATYASTKCNFNNNSSHFGHTITSTVNIVGNNCCTLRLRKSHSASRHAANRGKYAPCGRAKPPRQRRNAINAVIAGPPGCCQPQRVNVDTTRIGYNCNSSRQE